MFQGHLCHLIQGTLKECLGKRHFQFSVIVRLQRCIGIVRLVDDVQNYFPVLLTLNQFVYFEFGIQILVKVRVA